MGRGWDLLSPALGTRGVWPGGGSPASRGPEAGGHRLSSPRRREGVAARNAGAGGAVSSRAGLGCWSVGASDPAGPSWEVSDLPGAVWPERWKFWGPWRITGRKPRSGSACWAGAGTGSMRSTGNCRPGAGRGGPGRESGALRGVAALPALGLRRSPLAAVKMGVSFRRGSGAWEGGSPSLPPSPAFVSLGEAQRVPFATSRLGLLASQAVVLNKSVVRLAWIILEPVGETKDFSFLTKKKKEKPSAKCMSPSFLLLINITRMNETRGPTPANGATGTRLTGIHLPVSRRGPPQHRNHVPVGFLTFYFLLLFQWCHSPHERCHISLESACAFLKAWYWQ